MSTIMMFPGQGSQKRGMGKELFSRYPDHVRSADARLGYSIVELCLDNPDGRLDQTAYTQPALFVVNALSYLARQQEGQRADCALGHSLGEYSALFAAGVFDFDTGLALVAKRGALMGRATGGGMSAVLGLSSERIEQALRAAGIDELDQANVNTPTQVVLAGPLDALERAQRPLLAAGAKYVVPLRVSAAFHSRYMRAAAREFRAYLEQFRFSAPVFPVYANVDGQPYEQARVHTLLADQIERPVRWLDSVRACLALPAPQFVEVDGGRTLSKMISEIEAMCGRLPRSAAATQERATSAVATKPVPPGAPERLASRPAPVLGSAGFLREFQLQAPYMAGAMYRGIASEELVIALANAGFLGSFGAGGLDHEHVERSVRRIRQAVGTRPFAVNLLHTPARPDHELALVQRLIASGVLIVEAAAFTSLTPALLYYRAKGLRVQPNGALRAQHRIIAKVSRPEVAEVFMKAPSEGALRELVQRGLLTSDEAQLAARTPIADAITAEADSGGHTDKAVLTALVPAMRALRDQVAAKTGVPLYVGAAGGIGTPTALAAAFVLGADYVVTGSINQCTVESGASESVKELLQQVEIQDTTMAPAADMFEIGARVQVVRRGVLFPVRANKLYDLYRTHESLEQIDPATRLQLEQRYFRCTIDDIWRETSAYFARRDPTQIERAAHDAKHKMALVFRWYLAHASRLATEGRAAHRVDYQVHCGPAMGAFNAWVRGTALEPWTERRVADIAARLLQGAQDHLRGWHRSDPHEGTADRLTQQIA